MRDAADFMKPLDYSTPASKRKFVESECRRTIDVVNRMIPDTKAYLDEPYGARRRRAILNYMDRAEEEFRVFGLSSVVESFAKNELSPFNNYNDLDDDGDIRIGAALWILGKLRASGKMHEAYRILPDTVGDIEAFYLPPDFHHPCYDNDLIQSVIYVLSNRYKSKGVITAENARDKEPHARYQALMELLPEDDVKRARETFKAKLWELASRKLKGRAYYDKAIARALRQMENAEAGPLMVALDTEEIARKGESLLEQRSDYDVSFEKYLQMDRKRLRRETGSREVADACEGFTVDDPYEICFALYNLIDSGDDAPWLMGSGSSLVIYALHMLPWYVYGQEWDDEIWEDWFDGMEYNRNGWMEREAPPEQLDFYHEKHGGRNLAQIIYGLCHGVVPVGLHPFEEERMQLVDEGLEDDKARKITDISEMLFLHSFQAKQYRWLDEDFDSDSADEGGDDSEIAAREAMQKTETRIPLKIGGYWGKVAENINEEQIQTDVASDASEEENLRLRTELAQAKKRIKELQSALSTEKHTAGAERAKYEHELRGLKLEHRELADLRSLVFNRENEVSEIPTKGYEYPYETRKRTVIFGGHEKWLKSIKPMLPSVRFVDPDTLNFSPEIIRNAEVVWIQNNCISHSQFWAIIKTSKLAGVQIRYFGYSSAEKCAEQLVTEDQK